MRIVAVLACLLGIALLPASAHASQLVIGVYAQGPGTITGAGLTTPCVSTAGTGTKKLCGLVNVGYADEPSSSEAPSRRHSARWTLPCSPPVPRATRTC